MNTENSNKVLTFPNAPSAQKRQKFLHKVDAWLQKRYSTSIRFIETYALDSLNLRGLGKHRYEKVGRELFFPVLDDERLVGCLALTPKAELSDEKTRLIVEILDGVVSPFVAQLHRTDRLKVEESRLQNTSFASAGLSVLGVQPEFNDDENEAGPIYIEGSNREQIRRYALDLHLKIETTFFLPFDQIDPEKRIISDELRTLGRASIFINDLCLYERKELGAVLELIRESNPLSHDLPVFMLGSTSNFCEVEQQLKLSSEEGAKLLSNCIYIDQ